MNERASSPGVNLYLVGFMATGKTTVGRLVAQRLGMVFLDSDVEIERRAGKMAERQARARLARSEPTGRSRHDARLLWPDLFERSR